MSSWGHRQQAKYILTAATIAGVFIIIAIYYGFFNHQPTCFDGKMNGDETGKDCGGSCLQICAIDQLNPIVLYSRIFQVNDGVFSLLVSVENPNATLYAEDVPYSFKVYDQNKVVIAERKGTTFIAPNKIFPIFEGAVKTGGSIPSRMVFQFDQAPLWRKAALTEPVLNVLNESLTVGANSSRLDASLENPHPYDFQGIEVVALLYDQDNNVFAASKTVVDSLGRRLKAPLTFTWPESFPATTTKIEIIPNIPYKDFIPKK